MISRLSVSTTSILPVLISILACSLSSWSSGKPPSEIITLTAFCTLLAFISVLDHSNHKIPNKLTLVPLPVVFFISFLLPNIHELSVTESWWVTPLIGALLAGTIFSAAYFLPNTNLGGGDVKLATLIGSISGFPLCLASLLVGLLIFAVNQALTGNKKSAPLAPYLYYGTLLSIIAAQQI